MMRGVMITVVFSMASVGAAQQVCYHSATEAVAAKGIEDGQGFRLESMRADAFSQGGWALVRSCSHPEWPGQMVRVAGAFTRVERGIGAAARAVVVSAPLVNAGMRVRVVRVEESVRMELTGVAQANGREGEQIAVRLLAVGDREQFVTGLVRRDGSVEIVGR